MKFPLISLLLAFASIAAFGQTVDEKKAAAEKWLAKGSFKVHYVGPYTSDFPVRITDKVIDFSSNPNNTYCKGNVPAAGTFEEGELVLTITHRKMDCDQIQYRFNPVTGEGHVRYRDQFKGPNDWIESTSKVNLVE